MNGWLAFFAGAGIAAIIGVIMVVGLYRERKKG